MISTTSSPSPRARLLFYKQTACWDVPILLYGTWPKMIIVWLRLNGWRGFNGWEIYFILGNQRCFVIGRYRGKIEENILFESVIIGFKSSNLGFVAMSIKPKNSLIKKICQMFWNWMKNQWSGLLEETRFSKMEKLVLVCMNSSPKNKLYHRINWN